MTAKEYLSQAYRLDKEAEMIIHKAEELRKSLYGRGQQNAVVRTENSDIIGKAVAKVMDYEKRADEIIDRLVDVRMEIEKTIGRVADDKQREVLERRYLMYMSWDRIADCMNYSKPYIFKLHAKGIQEIGKMIVNDSK